jgi:hypothetical protein
VADPGCFSRIPDPDFHPTRIPDPKSARKKRRLTNYMSYLSMYPKFGKIRHYFSCEVLKKKMLANFQRIEEIFTEKIVTKVSKVWVFDPGSEIRDPEKTYSGSQGHLAPDSGSTTLLLPLT